MGTIQNDAQLLKISELCPMIQTFIKRLNDRDPLVNWDFLEKQGFKQPDGTFFRITAGWRSADEQRRLFNEGRSTSIYKEIVIGRGSYYRLLSAKITNPAQVVTNAYIGQSYHNWGCAVDIVFRSLGYDWKRNYIIDGMTITSLQGLYRAVGLVRLAEQCGLSWGGDWSDFIDVVHFEYPVKLPTYLGLIVDPTSEQKKTYAVDNDLSWLGYQKMVSGGTASGTLSVAKKSVTLGLVLGAFGVWYLFFKKR